MKNEMPPAREKKGGEREGKLWLRRGRSRLPWPEGASLRKKKRTKKGSTKRRSARTDEKFSPATRGKTNWKGGRGGPTFKDNCAIFQRGPWEKGGKQKKKEGKAL